MIINRDLFAKSQRNEYHGESEQTDEEKMKAFEDKLRGRSFSRGDDEDIKEVFLQMGKQLKLSSSNTGLTAAATDMMRMGALQDMADNLAGRNGEDEDDVASTVEASKPSAPGSGEDDGSEVNGRRPKSKAKGKAKAKSQVWAKRDEAITDALAAHKLWMKDTQASCRQQIAAMKEQLQAVGADIKGEVENEVRLLQSRYAALRLVSGDVGAVQKLQVESSPHRKSGKPTVDDREEDKANDTAGAAEEKSEDKVEDKADVKGEDKVDGSKTGGDNMEVDSKQNDVAQEKGEEVERKEGSQSNRSSATNLVMEEENCEKALRKLIAKFSARPTQITSLTNAREALGNSPPCRLFRSLLTLNEFNAIEGEIMMCNAKPELTGVTSNWKVFKGALLDLLSMCKSGVKRLASAIETAKKVVAECKVAETDGQRKKKSPLPDAGNGPDGPGTAKKRKATVSLWEYFSHPENATTISTYQNGAETLQQFTFDVDLPAIVNCTTLKFLQSENVAKACLSVKKKVMESVEIGRGQRVQEDKPDGDGFWAALLKEFTEALPAGSKVENFQPPELLKEFFQPSAYCVLKDVESASTEPASVATFRFSATGTKQVALAPYSSIYNYLSGIGSAPAPKDVSKFLKCSTPELVKEFHAKHSKKQICYATVGPNDVLYIPAGFVFSEKVGAAHETTGIRISCLGPRHLAALEGVQRNMLAAHAPNERLEHAVNLLRLAGNS